MMLMLPTWLRHQDKLRDMFKDAKAMCFDGIISWSMFLSFTPILESLQSTWCVRIFVGGAMERGLHDRLMLSSTNIQPFHIYRPTWLRTSFDWFHLRPKQCGHTDPSCNMCPGAAKDWACKAAASLVATGWCRVGLLGNELDLWDV